MTRSSFSKQDTNFIKGVGILMIMMHNYFHLILPAPGENEFSYSFDTFLNFQQLILEFPGRFFRYSFSYFGHYGVQLFVFISAYGLYKSFDQKPSGYVQFLKKRVLKLYPTLVIAIFFEFFFLLLRNHTITGYELKSTLFKLSLIFNLVPGQALAVNGPWWFFSLIFQFYLIFPVLFWCTKKYGSPFLIIISISAMVLEYFINPFLVAHHLNLNFTVLGHLEVFSLGIFMAYRNKTKFSWWLIPVCLAIFAFGNYNRAIWILSFIAVTIIMIQGYSLIASRIKKENIFHNFFLHAGSISLFLFVVQGMVRHPLVDIAGKYNLTWLTLLLCGIYLSMVYIVSFLLKIIEEFVQRKIGKRLKI